jgi:hypothetical protein
MLWLQRRSDMNDDEQKVSNLYTELQADADRRRAIEKENLLWVQECRARIQEEREADKTRLERYVADCAHVKIHRELQNEMLERIAMALEARR